MDVAEKTPVIYERPRELPGLVRNDLHRLFLRERLTACLAISDVSIIASRSPISYSARLERVRHMSSESRLNYRDTWRQFRAAFTVLTNAKRRAISSTAKIKRFHFIVVALISQRRDSTNVAPFPPRSRSFSHSSVFSPGKIRLRKRD